VGGCCAESDGTVSKAPGIVSDGGRTSCSGARAVKADREGHRPCRGRGEDDRDRGVGITTGSVAATDTVAVLLEPELSVTINLAVQVPAEVYS